MLRGESLNGGDIEQNANITSLENEVINNNEEPHENQPTDHTSAPTAEEQRDNNITSPRDDLILEEESRSHVSVTPTDENELHRLPTEAMADLSLVLWADQVEAEENVVVEKTFTPVVHKKKRTRPLKIGKTTTAPLRGGRRNYA